MPRNHCPSCEKRLPYAGRRCVHCGWTRLPDQPPQQARPHGRRRRLGTGVVVLALAAALAVGYSNRYLPAVAEWYATFAARHLPYALSGFAVADTDPGAYFYCARQVARQMDGDFSVETFPSPAESRSVALGEGHYRIEATVEEARENGVQVRHGFTCEVRFERGRWVLERLTLDDLAVGEAAPARRSE